VSFRADTSTILDYDTTYLNLLGDGADLTWKKGPSFCQSYQLEDLGFGSVNNLVQDLNNSIADMDSPLWRALLYRQHVYVRGDTDLTACQDVPCRREWVCTLTAITSKEYAACLQAAGASTLEVAWAGLGLRQRIILGTVLSSATLLALCLCLCWYCPRYIRRRHYQGSISSEDDGIILEQTVAKTAEKAAPPLSAATPPASSESLESGYQNEDKQSPVLT